MDTLVALAANTLICLILVPQLIRLYKKKRARHVSLWLLLLVLPATLTWGIFGWLENKQLVVACSVMTVLINIITIILFVSSKQQQLQTQTVRRNRSNSIFYGFRRRK